jgi:hypothetical protein
MRGRHFSRQRRAVLRARLGIGMSAVGLLMILGALIASGAYATSSTVTISIKQASLTDHQCDTAEIELIINQIDTPADAPRSVTIFFATGTPSSVVADASTVTGGAAHYLYAGPNYTAPIANATAVIYAGWTGEFVESSGPCGATGSTTTSTTSSSTTTSSTTTSSTTTSTTPRSGPTSTTRAPSTTVAAHQAAQASQSPTTTPTTVASQVQGSEGTAAVTSTTAAVVGGVQAARVARLPNTGGDVRTLTGLGGLLLVLGGLSLAASGKRTGSRS